MGSRSDRLSSQSGSMPICESYPLVRFADGAAPTHGNVFEQQITLEDEERRTLEVRRIAVRLDAPTRDGELKLSVVTNVPAEDASAVAIAELYRKRWTLETMFFEMTQMLSGELTTMGYPGVALLGFGIALVSYNVLSVARSALRSAFGAEKIDEEVSSYYIANETRVMSEGLDVATDPEDWSPLATMSPQAFAGRSAAPLRSAAKFLRQSANCFHREARENGQRGG
jgi:Transposase DDE domain